MIKHNLKDFIKGWFIGDFEPTLLPSKDFEVSVKRYKSGDYEVSHTHKVSTEYTIIISGDVNMNGIIYQQDDIMIIKPNEYTDFRCLTDVVTCVVKTPCTKNDKYLKEFYPDNNG
jgi:hypothetical protein